MEQLGQLQEKSDKFSEYGATVVAISSDPADIEKSIEKRKLSFSVYADPSSKTIQAWGVPQHPNGIVKTLATFVVDGKGRIRYSNIANSDHIAEEALAVLKKIRQGKKKR